VERQAYKSLGTVAYCWDCFVSFTARMRAAQQRHALDGCVRTFRKWLHLPDVGAVHVALGNVAANLLPGDPAWLLVVGPPSCGKTEVVGAFAGLDFIYPAATITEAALLSG
jgi:hypothetical protein